MKSSLAMAFVEDNLEGALEGLTSKPTAVSMGGVIAPHNTPDASGVNTPSGASTPTVTKSPQTSGFLNTVKEKLWALASERSSVIEESNEQEHLDKENLSMEKLENEWAASEMQYASSRKDLDAQRLNKWKEYFKPRFAKVRAQQEGDENCFVKDFLSNDALREVVKPHDIPALKFLYDVDIDLPVGKEIGFTLTFSFHKNPFFTNGTLQKTFIVPNLYDEASKPYVQVEDGKLQVPQTP